MDSYPTYEEFPATGPEPGRVSGLLLTNEPPSATERDQLLSITSTAPGILDDLDRKIAYLQTQRNQIASYHRNARTILHPIRLVPDDVLYKIFTYTRVASLNLEPRPYSANPTEGLWPASQVCQQWRTLIIETPRFWSFIRVNLDSHSQKHTSRVSFLLSRVLGRARGQDLEVELESRENFMNMSMEAVFYTLLSTASQWTSLKLQIPTSSLPALNQGEGMFTHLRRLAIFPLFWSGDVDVVAFRLAKNLKTVIVKSARGGLQNSGIVLSRPSIERLSLLHALEKDDFHAFPDYTNLQHLEMVCSNLSLPTPPSTVQHDRITYLTLYESGHPRDAGAIRVWLRHFDFPQLTHLRLAFGADTPGDSDGRRILLPALLETDIISVQDIEIFCSLPQNHPLILGPFLESCPHSLRTLKLRVTNLRSAEFQRLCDKTLVPQLECLDLRGSTTDGSPLQQLGAVVQWRVGTIKKLRLNSAPTLSASGRSRWNEIEEQVEVRYGPRIEQFDGRIPLPEDGALLSHLVQARSYLPLSRLRAN